MMRSWRGIRYATSVGPLEGQAGQHTNRRGEILLVNECMMRNTPLLEPRQWVHSYPLKRGRGEGEEGE